MPTFEKILVAAVDRILPPGTLVVDNPANASKCAVHSMATEAVLEALPELAQRPGGLDACHPCLVRMRDAIRHAEASPGSPAIPPECPP
jgi:hypothetical protein